MNCLFGNPTKDKEPSMTDAAVEAGVEVYVVDAAWYDSGPWWGDLGKWLPLPERLLDWTEEVFDGMKELDMTPGHWLELDSVGVNLSLSRTVTRRVFLAAGRCAVVPSGLWCEGRTDANRIFPGVRLGSIKPNGYALVDRAH